MEKEEKKDEKVTDEDKGEIRDLVKEAMKELRDEKAKIEKEEDTKNKLIAIEQAKKDKEDTIVNPKTKEEKDIATEKYFTALIQGDMATLKVMSEGTNADGGFTVPTYLRRQVVEEQRNASVLRPLVNVIPNCPKQLDINQLIGRPITSWRGEKATKDTSTATFDQISLTPYSLAVIVVLTNELIMDSEVPGGITSYVTKLIGVAIAEEEDARFMIGTGATQPTGIDAYAATVGRQVTCAGNVLGTDCLIDATTRLNMPDLRNAHWLMNSVTYAKCWQLKDSQNRPIMLNDMSGKFPPTILGYPVVRQDSCPATRIWFCDPRGYWVGDRGGLNVMKSEHATIEGVGNLFEKNLTAIRVEKRVDGEIAESNKFVCVNGTN